MYQNVQNVQNLENQKPPRVTLGDSVEDILNRLHACHECIEKIEERVNGPKPKAPTEAFAGPNSLTDALDLAKGRLDHLQSRLVSLLDRF